MHTTVSIGVVPSGQVQMTLHADKIPSPRWPCGKASTLRAVDLGSIPAFAVGLFFFPKSCHSSGLTMILKRLHYQAPGVKRSVLGLVNPVSICCE